MKPEAEAAANTNNNKIKIAPRVVISMTENESISIADSDSAVAGASVAITEAEEDRAVDSLGGDADGASKLPSAPVVDDVTASSIAATDASVAGSSVAVTEVEEDILCSTRNLSIGSSAGIDNKKVIFTKESNLDLSICNEQNEEEDEARFEEDLAPMHLHALKSPARLKGDPKAAHARSRSSSRSRPGSRKNSPQPRASNLVGTTISPSHSVGSSLDGSGVENVLDPDLLLDKLGLRDLDANATHDEIQELLKKHISSNNGLPTLNERLSEDTLDDVHAFQDLVISKKSGDDLRESLRASQGPSSKILEVSLDALTEEDEDEDGLDGSGGRKVNDTPGLQAAGKSER